MSLKKAFTKMGLIEEEVAPKKAEVKAAPPSIDTLSATLQARYRPPTAEADSSILSMLQKSLQDNKLSGFDYMKFVSAIEEMKAMGSPEDTRFKMAFFTAKQLGVDKENLLKSGQHYLDVLAQDESDFKADCAQFEKNEIASRHAKLDEMEAKLKDLNNQIAQITRDHESLLNELTAKEMSLDSRKKSFQVTLENVRGSIQSNVKKIDQYL